MAKSFEQLLMDSKAEIERSKAANNGTIGPPGETPKESVAVAPDISESEQTEPVQELESKSDNTVSQSNEDTGSAVQDGGDSSNGSASDKPASVHSAVRPLPSSSVDMSPEASAELTPGGTEVSDAAPSVPEPPKREPAKPPKRGRGRKPSDSPTIDIKDFPKSLMQEVRMLFPDSTNNSDALAAFVYIKLGGLADVSDEIKELSKSFSGDRSLSTMDDRTVNIERHSRDSVKLLKEIEIAVSALVLNGLGLNKSLPRSGKDVDFLEPGVLDVRGALQLAANKQRARDLQDENRKVAQELRNGK